MTSQTASYIAALRRAYAKTTEPGKRSELRVQLRLNGVDPDAVEELKTAQRPSEAVPGRTEPVRLTAEKTTPDKPASRRGRPRGR